MILGCASLSGAQNVSEERSPSRPAESSAVAQQVRTARDRLFNLEGLPPLSAEKPGVPPRVTRQDKFPLSELPLQDSDTVLVATVSTIASRILPGETGIYSEYRAVASRIIYNRSTWSGPDLEILHLGGAVQTATGRAMRHILTGQGLPLEGGREYLMFLRYLANAECFQFVKVWRVQEGVVRANADDDIARVKLGKSQVEGRPLEWVLSSLLSGR